MPIYLLSPSPDQSAGIEHQIREVIPHLTRIAKIEDAAIRHRPEQADDPAYVLIPAPAGDNGYLDRLIDVALRHREQMFFILISDDISAVHYKRLLRTGGIEWVSAAGAPQEIIEIISLRRERFESMPPRTAASSVAGAPVAVAFAPSAGGVGNATLVTEIGVQLKTAKPTKDLRACIVDLDFQSSHVCDYLDIEPHLQIQEIAKNPERFDAHLCELFATRHASGLDVFAAPRRFNASDLNIAALDALFDMIATRYDLILIDLPTNWFAWTSNILANADGVIITGTNTIPCLRQLTELLVAVRSFRGDTSQLAVVINRYEPTLTGGVARRAHVESVLPDEKVFFVRDDPAVMADCINVGTPIVLNRPSRKTARELAAVAKFCAQLKSIHASRA
jgi:pilus assembly protein CpaE